MLSAEQLSHGLEGFQVQLLTEVFRVNEDGRKTKSVGFFKDANIASAFAQNQVDASYHKVGNVWALVKGTDAILLGEGIELSSDEQAEQMVRQSALAKLSVEERKVLGL